MATIKGKGKQPVEEIDDDDERQEQPKGKDLQDQQRNLDRLQSTEEGNEGEIDAATAGAAMSGLMKSAAKPKAPKKAADASRIKIKLNRADVEMIMKDMEVSRDHAENALRERNGDVSEALSFLMDESRLPPHIK